MKIYNLIYYFAINRRLETIKRYYYNTLLNIFVLINISAILS